MTLDEQYQFMMERPTPTTPMQYNQAPDADVLPVWIEFYTGHPDLSHLSCWQVRWKPEPKTVPAWPPVKPYWVKFAGTDKIMATTGFWNGQVIIGGTWYPLHALEHDLWTDDLRADPVVWHPFTKEIEE